MPERLDIDLRHYHDRKNESAESARALAVDAAVKILIAAYRGGTSKLLSGIGQMADEIEHAMKTKAG